MFDWRDYKNGIYALDAGYVRPLLASIHLVVSEGRVALIDTGSKDALPNVLEALGRLGLGREAVDYVILTHVHLDHAGGAGYMMREFPRAKLVVHPRGARHMADPGKLIAGVIAVYGAAYVAEIYGDILPIAPERIVKADDGYVLQLGARELVCLDTPGHARHHICIQDRQTSGIFTGDMFGLSYREMDVDGREFIFPTTTPTQFEPDAMKVSIKRLLALRPEVLYLTHYSRVGNVEDLGEDLLRRLAMHISIAERRADEGDGRHQAIVADLTDYLQLEARNHGCQLSLAELLPIWETDLELNAQGLGVWLDSREG